MATYFFDSSALAKRYHAEEGCAKVEAIFREPGRRIIISHLTVIEIGSAIAGKVRSGVLNQAEATSVADHFKANVAAGFGSSYNRDRGLYAEVALHQPCDMTFELLIASQSNNAN